MSYPPSISLHLLLHPVSSDLSAQKSAQKFSCRLKSCSENINLGTRVKQGVHNIYILEHKQKKGVQ